MLNSTNKWSQMCEGNERTGNSLHKNHYVTKHEINYKGTIKFNLKEHNRNLRIKHINTNFGHFPNKMQYNPLNISQNT